MKIFRVVTKHGLSSFDGSSNMLVEYFPVIYHPEIKHQINFCAPPFKCYDQMFSPADQRSYYERTCTALICAPPCLDCYQEGSWKFPFEHSVNWSSGYNMLDVVKKVLSPLLYIFIMFGAL